LTMQWLEDHCYYRG